MGRRKPRRPYFRNRVEEAKRKTQTNLHATSKATGIQHVFGNVEGWENVIEDFERKQEAQKTQLFSSLTFYKWLENQTIDQNQCSCKLNDFSYRYANPKFGPIAIAGSLGHGGRFNIGGPQLDSNFQNLRMFGSLYLASSEECAKDEAAKPIGVHQLFKLKPKKELLLWDLGKVIGSLDYPNLLELVKATHGEKIWAYQKIPTESQILAHKLKLIKGDGIIFESTKMKDCHNISLFFDNDEAAKNAIEIIS